MGKQGHKTWVEGNICKGGRHEAKVEGNKYQVERHKEEGQRHKNFREGAINLRGGYINGSLGHISGDGGHKPDLERHIKIPLNNLYLK